MKSRIESELFDILTLKEKEKFDISKTLNRINNAMKKQIKWNYNKY